jgi:hypothetical protein
MKKAESTEFTANDLQGFLDQMLDHDRMVLADRLQQASDRLAEIAPRVKAGHGADGWSAHEVLAHIAVLSKFYGVVFHRISSGKMTELDLLSNVNLRDGMDEEMAALDPQELLRMCVEDHARTIKALRTVELESMRRAAIVDGGAAMTAEQVARLPLISHLELHLEQLEKALS